jgi:hypothetical protein
VINKAKVYEDAIVETNAWIFDNIEVYGKASINGDVNI